MNLPLSITGKSTHRDIISLRFAKELISQKRHSIVIAYLTPTKLIPAYTRIVSTWIFVMHSHKSRRLSAWIARIEKDGILHSALRRYLKFLTLARLCGHYS